jgi:hypothetical protein
VTERSQSILPIPVEFGLTTPPADSSSAAVGTHWLVRNAR